MVSFDKGLQWRNVKQKPSRQIQVNSLRFQLIQTYLSISKFIQELFGHIENPLQPWHIQNSGIFRNQNHIYKLWYIQNPDIFRTIVYLEPLVYSDEKTTNLFNWYFSQLIYTLLQQTKHRKLILPLTSSICLFIYLFIQSSFLSINTINTKKTHKPLKVAAAKTIFSSEYVIATTCFDQCFLFHVITG